MTRKKTKTATTPEPAFSPARIPPALPRLVFAFFVIVLMISTPVQGRQRPQPNDYALIFGTVWGPGHRPVYGVKVKIRKAGDQKSTVGGLLQSTGRVRTARSGRETGVHYLGGH